MKNSNNSVYNYFDNHKVAIEDYERIKYPSIDVKRAVIEKMLADKINELYRIIDELEHKIASTSN